MIKTTDQNSWQNDILNGTIVVDFYADWCGPCKAMSPTVDKISGELAPSISTYKINVDNVPDAAVKFSIRSVPVVMVIKDGVEVTRFTGFTPYSKLKDGMAEYMAAQ